MINKRKFMKNFLQQIEPQQQWQDASAAPYEKNELELLLGEINAIRQSLFPVNSNNGTFTATEAQNSVLFRAYKGDQNEDKFTTDKIASYYNTNKTQIDEFFNKQVPALILTYRNDLPRFKEEFVKGLQALPNFDVVNPFAEKFVNNRKIDLSQAVWFADNDSSALARYKSDNSVTGFFLDNTDTEDELANFKKASDYLTSSLITASFNSAAPAEQKKSIFEIILQIISKMIGQDLSQFFPVTKKDNDGLTQQEFEATKNHYQLDDGKAELHGKVAGVIAALTADNNKQLINLLVNSTDQADFVNKLNEELGAIEIDVNGASPARKTTLKAMGVNFAGASETLLTILRSENAKGYKAIKNHAILQKGGFIDNTAGKEGQLTQSFFDDANISKQVAAQLAILANSNQPTGVTIPTNATPVQLQNLLLTGTLDGTTPNNYNLNELWNNIKDKEITFKVVDKEVKMTVANFAQYSGVNVGDSNRTGEDFLPALMNVGGGNLKTQIATLQTPDLTPPAPPATTPDTGTGRSSGPNPTDETPSPNPSGTGSAPPQDGRSPKSYKEHLADYKTAMALIYDHYGDGRNGRTFNSLLDRIDNDRSIADNKKQEIKFLAGTIMSNYTGAFTDVFNPNMNKFRADPTADYNRPLRAANVDEFKNYLNRSVRRADRMVKRYSPAGDGSDIFLSKNDYEFMTEKVNGIYANSENRAGGLIKYFGDAFNQGNIARRRSFFGSGDLWRARQATLKEKRETNNTSSLDPSATSSTVTATATNPPPTLPKVFQNLGNDPAEQNYLAGLVGVLQRAGVTTDNNFIEQKNSFYELAAKLASGYVLVTNSDGTITAKKNGQDDIEIYTLIPVTGGQTITGVDLSANGNQSQELNKAIDLLVEKAFNVNSENYKLTGINAGTFNNMPSGSSGRGATR